MLWKLVWVRRRGDFRGGEGVGGVAVGEGEGWLGWSKKGGLEDGLGEGPGAGDTRKGASRCVCLSYHTTGCLDGFCTDLILQSLKGKNTCSVKERTRYQLYGQGDGKIPVV